MALVLSLFVTTVNAATNGAAAEPRVEPVRRVVLVASAARAVIVEAKLGGRFWFERCYLPADARRPVKQSVQKGAYRTCARFTVTLPDDEATRGEFNRQFSDPSINDQFERYGRGKSDTLVLASTVGMALFGGLIPLVKIPRLAWLHSTKASRILTAGAITGVIGMVVSGWYAGEHPEMFRLARELEDKLDADLTSPGVIHIDNGRRARVEINHAVEVFENAIAVAARATLQTRSN